MTMAYDPSQFRILLFGGYLTGEDFWEFGAGVVSLTVSPTHDGTVEFDNSSAQSYSTPVSIDLGFGNHALAQTPFPW
ncbi:MAG: hypothetical protein L3K04_02630, partial [Thermoplasmata archaeon]|nr:hypothetical protein [Thermoplasmata archaeon]